MSEDRAHRRGRDDTSPANRDAWFMAPKGKPATCRVMIRGQLAEATGAVRNAYRE